MQPDLNWFRAPEDHFWYWAPSEEYSPPFAPDPNMTFDAVTAPIPSTREAMEQFVRVLIYGPDDELYWRGEMLSEFPKYGMLSDEDIKAWLDWLATDDIKEFLDRAIAKCKTQAAINKEASGWAVISAVEDTGRGYHRGYKVVDDPTEGSH
jgi:hypothetical protein